MSLALPQAGILGFTRGINPIPVPNQVTSRATFLPFTVGTNDWQGRFRPFKTATGLWGGCWIEGTQHSAGTAADQRFNIVFSDDEGATWTDNNEYIGGGAVGNFPLGVHAGGASFVNECQVILCPNGDLVLIAFERSSTYTTITHSQWRSTDHGANWTWDQDFVDAVGISDNTKLQACYEHMVVDNEIYVIFMEIRTDLNDTRMRLFKSTDNCATWDFVSNPVEYDEADPDCTESSIAHLGGNRFACIFRTQDFGAAVSKISEDRGVTWGALTDFRANIGYVGVHQPRVKQYSNFFMLMGRDMKPVLDNENGAVYSRTAYWTTTDLFASPAKRRYLDPFYAGIGTEDITAGDSGYGSALEKSDGSFMFFGYWGTQGASMIYKYDVSHTNSPETENYANNNYFPQNLTTAGIRCQLNRDNCFISPASPTLGGIGIITRAHNTLLTGGYALLGTGITNAPELIYINDKGWAIFNSSRVSTQVTVGNTLYRNSFSVGMWLMPDDGQPAASQMLYNDRSTGPTATTDATSDRVQIILLSTGVISAGYMINNTNVEARTSTAVFANGAISTPVHLAVTFTSGGLIRIYVDGVLQTLDGSFLGDISALTMSSYTTSRLTHIGMRENTTFDLPYLGKMREVICQPVVWSAGDITNIMLN